MKFSLVLAITALMNVTDVSATFTIEDGKRGLELTNLFRADEAVRALRWSDFLYV